MALISMIKLLTRETQKGPYLLHSKSSIWIRLWSLEKRDRLKRSRQKEQCEQRLRDKDVGQWKKTLSSLIWLECGEMSEEPWEMRLGTGSWSQITEDSVWDEEVWSLLDKQQRTTGGVGSADMWLKQSFREGNVVCRVDQRERDELWGDESPNYNGRSEKGSGWSQELLQR